jgi:hypothetical protein
MRRHSKLLWTCKNFFKIPLIMSAMKENSVGRDAFMGVSHVPEELLLGKSEGL